MMIPRTKPTRRELMRVYLTREVDRTFCEWKGAKQFTDDEEVIARRKTDYIEARKRLEEFENDY